MQVFRLGFDWNVNSLNLWWIGPSLFFKVHQSSYHHASNKESTCGYEGVCKRFRLKQLDLWDFASHVHFVMLDLCSLVAQFQ